MIVPKKYEDKPNSHVYVEFADRESLENAVKLDGMELSGRAVKIDVAAARQTGGYGERRGYGGASERRDGAPAGAGGDAAAGAASNAPPTERKKLALVPRSAAPAAAAASAAAASSSDASAPAAAARKPNPFGDAKPREEILMGRGVDPVAVDSKADVKQPAAQTAGTDSWNVAKGEQKPVYAGAKKPSAGAGGDVASHPVTSAGAGAAGSSSASRSGVVRGGRTGVVGSRGGDASASGSAAAAGPEKVMTRLADASAGAATAASKKTPVGQAPPSKKVVKKDDGPANLFSALSMGDEAEEEEEQEEQEE